jgi:hypothetical protein
MVKKNLEYLSNTDSHTLDEMYQQLRDYGATDEMFEHLCDTVKAQHDRFGELKISQGLGIDRTATVTHSETGEDIACELIVFHMDISRASEPEVMVNRVVVGFMLKDGKIDQMVQMDSEQVAS